MKAPALTQRSVSPRSGVGSRALQVLLRGDVGLLVLAVLALWPLLTNNVGSLNTLLYIAIYGVAALGLNLAVGIAGEYAVGQGGLFAAGAYMTAVLMTKYGWGFWAAAAVAGLFAAGVGLAAGLPGLRAGGWSFAMASFLVALVIPDLAGQLTSITGGSLGLSNIPLPTLGGHQLGVEGLYGLSLLVLAVILLAVSRLRRSLWGLAYASLRSSHYAAQANGLPLLRLRLIAYAFSSLMAGLAGAIFAVAQGYLSPQSFPLTLTILFFASVVLGGVGTLIGPVLGVAVLQYVPSISAGASRYSLIIYGVVIIAVMVIIPDGLVSALKSAWQYGLMRVLGIRRPERSTRGRSELDQDNVASADLAAQPLLEVASCLRPMSLRVEGAERRFGGVLALRDVSFVAKPGEITAIIGPNGSGKTTLLNVICGYYALDHGRIQLGDLDITTWKPSRRARQGISRTFQTPVLIGNRSAADNVLGAMIHQREVRGIRSAIQSPKAARDYARLREEVVSYLEMLGLGAVADSTADALTSGEQRLVEVAVAMARRSAVVLLDEPFAGLVGREVDVLADVLDALRRAGYAVVLIEHNVKLVMSVADRVVVLDSGALVADDVPSAVQANEKVLAAYLGRPPRVA
jgi:ABC-type branched-subunit amino acid transport system ATPase component/ABC-type branched-subunit amino acid transport system permease subunit